MKSNQEKMNYFNRFKIYIDPIAITNLENRVKNLDDRLILLMGLILSYIKNCENMDYINDLNWNIKLSGGGSIE